MKDWINIALPKGRLGENAYGRLKDGGFECPAIEDPGRKLIFENLEKRVRYFWVKPSDVAIYWSGVQRILVSQARIFCWNTSRRYTNCWI